MKVRGKGVDQYLAMTYNITTYLSAANLGGWYAVHVLKKFDTDNTMLRADPNYALDTDGGESYLFVWDAPAQ